MISKYLFENCTPALIALIVAPMLGCSTPSGPPYRPFVGVSAPMDKCKTAAVMTNRDFVTPEVAQHPGYTLHFLEFDDQGWPYPDAVSRGVDGNSSPGLQMDCAIADLAHKLTKSNVRSFVFVHGWKHSAELNDRDLNRFRALLQKEALEEQRESNPREVIGFYIAWNGLTLDFPMVKELTFWGRKNAAHHISEGSVRDFFSRLKALRNHYNRPNQDRSKNCGEEKALVKGLDCPLRTVMIGHSFGAWILYSATSPYILETLAKSADLPPDAKVPKTFRERGIADLIVLLNPAFEATRYEAVHRAAKRYKPERYEPPLLVSVTSTADSATKNIFPIARFFNTLFQYPAATESENQAMKHTHGHLQRYLTHELTVDLKRRSTKEEEPGSCFIDAQRKIPSDPQILRNEFFTELNGSLSPERWQRELCGGLTLKLIKNSELDPYSIVWNVSTSQDVIPNHSDVTELPLIEFIDQISNDMGREPKWRIER